MRILRVAQKIYPEFKGGGAYHVHALSRDQAAMGHDVTVLTVDHEHGERRTEQRNGYTLVSYPSTVTLFGNALSAGVARYFATTGKFDVVHAHSHLYFSTNLAAVRRLVGRPPLAITNHGLYSQTVPEHVFEGYLRTFGRLTFDCADRVFCYSEAEQSRLRDYGVDTNIAVVPNGIDQDRFEPTGPIHPEMDTDGKVILFVGRLVEGKRPKATLDAFQSVAATHEESRLYVVGDGPQRERLEARAISADIKERVTFLGHVSYDDMPSVYRGADVLVLPSRTEGVPRTILEAMASGVPVVASSLPQLDPVVGDGGELVPIGGDLESAIDRVLTDPSTYDPGRAAEKYAWEQTVQATTEYLERLQQ
ncbi:glycosyltransferase family 4 protein [Haloarcula sp. GH36]|uniref:glycosyltransferase family 4 protein n=1 Tax=Haloarcula montana TaxID=3111776 RepID=UPI002D7A251A|nr:glycosyltransferase family 4 protein [Haloarcula sp. GH36]